MAKFLDPQRQYAQLLSLWAQGNKIIRRQTNGQFDAPVLRIWQLGQSMASHGVNVLPISLDPAIVMISSDHQGVVWCVLVDKEWGQSHSDLFRRMLWLNKRTAPALSTGEVWSVSMDLASRLGRSQWSTLCQWIKKDVDVAEIDTESDAITVLAGLTHQPYRIGKASAQDWSGLSRLWRHQGTWQSVTLAEPQSYAWLVWDLPSKKYLWPHDQG